MNDSEFVTQTQIGAYFNVSTFDMGRWLMALELRTKDGRPTLKAKAGGYCASRSTDRGPYPRPFTVWHREKTIQALKEAGYPQIAQKRAARKRNKRKTLERPIGPFRLGERIKRKCNIYGSNNMLVMRVYCCDESARLIVALLNVSHKHGHFQPDDKPKEKGR